MPTTITVSFTNVDPDDARAAQYVLGQVNASRADQQLPPYANVAEMLQEMEIRDRILPKYKRMEADARAEQENLLTKFRDADDTTRQQIVDLLNA